MPKKRITLRLDDNEVAVVGPIERWQHLILLYEAMAEEFPESKAAWLDSADWIKTFVSKSNMTKDENGWN